MSSLAASNRQSSIKPSVLPMGRSHKLRTATGPGGKSACTIPQAQSLDSSVRGHLEWNEAEPISTMAVENERFDA